MTVMLFFSGVNGGVHSLVDLPFAALAGWERRALPPCPCGPVVEGCSLLLVMSGERCARSSLDTQAVRCDYREKVILHGESLFSGRPP